MKILYNSTKYLAIRKESTYFKLGIERILKKVDHYFLYTWQGNIVLAQWYYIVEGPYSYI